MNNLEQRLRAYIEQLEAEAGHKVKIGRKKNVLPCFVLLGVLLSVLLFFRERK